MNNLIKKIEKNHGRYCRPVVKEKYNLKKNKN